MNVASANKPKDLLSFRVLPDSARKPGFLFRHGVNEDLFFWCDLMQVRYNPKGNRDDAEPEEMLTFFFHRQEVTVRGHRLGGILTACQQHLIDYIRESSREAIMGSGTPNEEPLITSIKIGEAE